MIIKGKRIRKLENHLPRLTKNQPIVFGVGNIERFSTLMDKISFAKNLEFGDSILPSPAFGPISKFNANGKLMIYKNRPKETVYRLVEWHWKQWSGKDSTEERTKLVDVPYKRYPREMISPPSVELSIAAGSQGQKLIVSPQILFDGNNQADLVHCINLFLEIFGECQVFNYNLDAIINSPIKHLNWTILPRGNYPWNQLKPQVQELIERVPKGNQKLVANRLETINKYNPDFVAIGRAGFRGYVIFGFSGKNLFLLESIRYGNATYLLGEQWQKVSVLTKAEILSDHLHKARIVHRVGWHRQINKLLTA